MISEVTIAELFVATEEISIFVSGVNGYFDNSALIAFLEDSKNDVVEHREIFKAITEKFGEHPGFYTVICELNYVPAEYQGEFSEHVLPAYYDIGNIISTEKSDVEVKEIPF